MGASHSSVQNSVLNSTVNMADIQNTTKNIQETATNTLVKNASTCDSTVKQTNSCAFTGNKAGGDQTFNADQTNTATVDFSCVQANTAVNSMTSVMLDAIGNELNVLNGSEAAAKLNAMAAAATTGGFGGIGAGSKSNASTSVKNEVSNITKSIVESIFQQNLSSNFNSETVNECIGKTEQANAYAAADNTAGGSQSGTCVQTNSLVQVQECKQLTEAINKTLSQSAQELGFKISTSSNTTSNTQSTAGATSETVHTGPIQDLGNAISGIFSSMAAGEAMSLGIICCVICCCLIACLFFMKGSGSGASGDSVTGNIDETDMSKIDTTTTVDLPNNDLPNNDLQGGGKLFNFLGIATINLISDVLSDSSL
jgi:hypothetical protein